MSDPYLPIDFLGPKSEVIAFSAADNAAAEITLGLYRDYPVSKGCTSPRLPDTPGIPHHWPSPARVLDQGPIPASARRWYGALSPPALGSVAAQRTNEDGRCP